MSYALFVDLSVLLKDLFLFGEPLGDVLDSSSDSERSSDPELEFFGAFLRNFFMYFSEYKIKIINSKLRSYKYNNTFHLY
tara:strand:+ start:377 stop:616 length:240 start_codon:yes stop_codon:yes gene_type:complete